MVDIPEYETYSLLDLYQVLNNIRSDLYPDIYEALLKEIDRREPRSIGELEDCYFALDKNKNPEFEAKLRGQIEQLGGLQYARAEEITEENKYRTFWRRFWAHFLDGLVVGVPLAIGLIIVEKAGLIESATSTYVEQILQVIVLSYYIIMHAKYGQTVGKMATGVKVLDNSEQQGISLNQAVIRDIVPVFMVALSAIYLLVFGAPLEDAEVTGIPAFIQYATGYAIMAWWIAEVVTMLFNRKRRAVHDLIARTVVVRVAPQHG